jgi:hypothetical protein
MLTLTLLPLGVLALAMCFELMLAARAVRRARPAVAALPALLTAYLVLPTATVTVYSAWADEIVDKEESATTRLLASDPSIDWDSAAHQRMLAYAMVMAVVYTAGVPFALLWTLLRARKGGEGLRSLLLLAYRPEMVWWEVVEVVRMLLLAGLALLVGTALQRLFEPTNGVVDGRVYATALQLLFALFVQLVVSVAHAHVQPMESRKHAVIALFAHCALCLILAFALAHHLSQQLALAGGAESSPMEPILGQVMRLTTLLAMLVGAGVLALETWAEQYRPVLRDLASGQRIYPAPPADGKAYDVFISHVCACCAQTQRAAARSVIPTRTRRVVTRTQCVPIRMQRVATRTQRLATAASSTVRRRGPSPRIHRATTTCAACTRLAGVEDGAGSIARAQGDAARCAADGPRLPRRRQPLPSAGSEGEGRAAASQRGAQQRGGRVGQAVHVHPQESVDGRLPLRRVRRELRIACPPEHGQSKASAAAKDGVHLAPPLHARPSSCMPAVRMPTMMLPPSLRAQILQF